MTPAAELSLAMVNAVLAITLIEGGVLVAWRAFKGRGPAVADVVANLAAGVCLLGALRSVLGGEGALACAVWLAGAGASHALDLWRRWPNGVGSTTRPATPTTSSSSNP